MKHVLKAMLIASVLGTGAVATSSQANAHDYYGYQRHSGTSVYFSTGRVGIGYYRGDNRDEGWRWRHRCYRWGDCGRHYGWRNSWRHRDYWRDRGGWRDRD